MSIDLHHPLRGHRFGLAAQVPEVPQQVRGPLVVTEGTLLHRIGGCPDGQQWRADTAEVLNRGVLWCAHRSCWHGRRCDGCGFPSGVDHLCRTCGTNQHNFERRLGDAP